MIVFKSRFKNINNRVKKIINKIKITNNQKLTFSILNKNENIRNFKIVKLFLFQSIKYFTIKKIKNKLILF